MHTLNVTYFCTLKRGLCIFCHMPPPGTIVPGGLMFCRIGLCDFSERDLRAPSADRHEILPLDRNLLELYEL